MLILVGCKEGTFAGKATESGELKLDMALCGNGKLDQLAEECDSWDGSPNNLDPNPDASATMFRDNMNCNEVHFSDGSVKKFNGGQSSCNNCKFNVSGCNAELVCEPYKWGCVDENTRGYCSWDGTSYNSKEECPGGCQDGACVEVQEEVSVTPGMEDGTSGGLNSVCGDGIMQGIEQCDDGNNIDEDGCDADCEVEFNICGNNHSEFQEQCDGSDLAGVSCVDFFNQNNFQLKNGVMACDQGCNFDIRTCLYPTCEEMYPQQGLKCYTENNWYAAGKPGPAKAVECHTNENFNAKKQPDGGYCAPAPDLTVGKISTAKHSNQNNSIVLNVTVEVKNIGTATEWSNFTIAVGNLQSTVYGPEVGQSTTTSVLWVCSGQGNVTVEVDLLKQIDELNENNNKNVTSKIGQSC